MMRRVCLAWLLCGAALSAAAAPRQGGAHRFAVIGHQFASKGGEDRLEKAIDDTRDPALAFVVAIGIKAESEPCSDTLYMKRREMFDDSRRPMIVLPAGSDWTECRDSAGNPVTVERLNRLREIFYPDSYSLGRRSLSLMRLSTTAKFRSYSENAHWVVGKVLYATVNLPAQNNHYLADAGRNSEFEDRSVANRFWLKRLFTMARRTGAEAIVIFSEGDIKMLAEPRGLLARLRRAPTSAQDGFVETRRQLGALAQKYRGRILLVDGTPRAAKGKPALAWRDNIGHLSAGSDPLEIRVTPGTKTYFELEPSKNDAHPKADQQKTVKRRD